MVTTSVPRCSPRTWRLGRPLQQARQRYEAAAHVVAVLDHGTPNV